MGKIIISLSLLKDNFIPVAFKYVDKYSKDKDKEKIFKELNEAKTSEVFASIYDKYFGNEIKLLL